MTPTRAVPLTYRLGRTATRGVAACLVVTLALLLTPCCEIFAALQDAGSSPAGTVPHADHADHDDGHAPQSSDHCAPWLDQVFAPVSGTTEPAVLSQGAGMSVPVSVLFPTPLSWSGVKIVPHAGAPPPTRALYLLTLRLRI